MTNINAYRHIYRKTDRQTDTHAGRKADKQTETDCLTSRQTGKPGDRQID